MKVLVSSPDFETATHYGSYYYNYIVKDAIDNGFEVLVLYEDRATRINFLNRIRKDDPVLVSGVGHGNENVFTGQNEEILMQTGDPATVEISKGRHFVLLSCTVGKVLGKKIVEEYGGIAFQGYDEEFIFMATDYPNDYASWFFNAHSEIEKALHKGATHEEAYHAAQDAWDNAIKKAPLECRPYLIHDKECHVLWGDKNARIVEEPVPPVPPENCPFWKEGKCTNPDCQKCDKTCRCEEPEFGKCIQRLFEKYFRK